MFALILNRTGECHNRLKRALAFFQQLGNRFVILNSTFNGTGDNHSPGLTTDFSFGNHFRMEMLYHNVSFFMDSILVGFHIVTKQTLCSFLIELRIILNGFCQLIVALYRGKMAQYVHDETFLNGLLHRVYIMRLWLRCSIRQAFLLAEHFQSFILRCCGKRKIACILYHLATLDDCIDLVFQIIFIIIDATREHHVHLCRQTSVLAGMGFVNQNSKVFILMYLANIIQNELELMDDGNNDFLAFVQELLQLTGTLCPTNGCRYLHKLFDGILDLLVQIDTVSHDDNRIKNFFSAVVFQRNELMCQPCNRIGLTGTGAVLNQIAPTNTVTLCITEQRLHHRKLMIAREHLLILGDASILIFFSNDLSIVFNNIGQLILGQNLFPKVIGFDTVWIWRVACTVIKSFVKW